MKENYVSLDQALTGIENKSLAVSRSNSGLWSKDAIAENKMQGFTQNNDPFRHLGIQKFSFESIFSGLSKFVLSFLLFNLSNLSKVSFL